MGPLDKTAQPGLDHKLLRDIIETVETCALFVLDDRQNVQLCNNQGQDLAGGGDVTEWLRTARFHTVADKQPLVGKDAPLARCFGQGLTGPIVAGWLDQRGGERVFEFRGKPVGGLSVLTLQDCTQLWALRETLADMPRPSAGQDSVNVAGVAHDLGNVFGTLQLASRNLAGLDLPEGAQQHLQDVVEACARGNAVLDSLFDPAATGETPPTPVDVASFLRMKSDRIAQVMPKRVTLQLDLPDGPCLCQCRESELELALLSMVGYVREAVLKGSGKVGAVTLGLCAAAGMLDIEVATADGNPVADRPMDLHDSYFTSERAMRSGGVGLVVAERFARHGGGALRILRGQAGELRLVLSLLESVAPASATEPTGAEGDLDGYRILLAERDTHLRKLLTEALRQFGARVAAVSNGEDAIHILDREMAPDVLVTNLAFADGVTSTMLGEKVARNHPATRVIVVSGSPNAPDSLELGSAVLFLRKPVQIDVLRNAIRLRPPGRR